MPPRAKSLRAPPVISESMIVWNEHIIASTRRGPQRFLEILEVMLGFVEWTPVCPFLVVNGDNPGDLGLLVVGPRLFGTIRDVNNGEVMEHMKDEGECR